jgi:DNA processing protein
MLGVGARRLRALALGDQGALREWIASESACRLAITRRDVGSVVAAIERAGAWMTALGDPAYPAGLRDLRNPPAFLVVRGVLPPSAAGGTGTAIVGTRDASERARDQAYALAARCDPPMVSGLAHGIDAAAHRGALAAGVAQIAYVGHGLGVVYPPDHAELEDAIVAAGGAVASERLPGERANRWSLVQRDRLQAAHARRIILVQSEVGGGAMHTMNDAERLGRERFALEPLPGTAYAGNELALRRGALPLRWDVA